MTSILLTNLCGLRIMLTTLWMVSTRDSRHSCCWRHSCAYTPRSVLVGDDSHDTLNKGSYSEEHFGFPFCFYNGSSFTDTSNDDSSFVGSLSYSNACTCMFMDCSTLKTQTVSLGSHAAPLGMRFCSAQLNSNFSSSDCQGMDQTRCSPSCSPAKHLLLLLSNR